MKRVVLLTIITIISLQGMAQSFIKTNPFRAFLGEASLFYEQQLPHKRLAFEFRVGYVYKMSALQLFSRTKMELNPTYFFYYHHGLTKGPIVGASIIRYSGEEEKSVYFKLSANFRFLTMENVELALTEYQDNTRASGIIDGEHFIFNPQITMGFNTKDNLMFSPYWGIGVNYRQSRITNVECSGQLPYNYTGNCIDFARVRRSVFHSNRMFPSIHVGCLIGIKTRERRD